MEIPRGNTWKTAENRTLKWYIAPLLDTHHDVAWLDFSVDKVSLDRVLPLKLFSEYPFYL